LALAIKSARRLIPSFDETAALVSRPPRSAIATRILPALVTAVAVALVAAGTGGLGFVTPALAQASALTQAQVAARAACDEALREFKEILAKRRAQIDAKQALPNLPGQAVYHPRIKVMSTYKDFTDALPSRIGRPNRFGVPPAYLDADIEPLIEEYAALFRVMQAPPAYAQVSSTPFKDVVDLGTAIARAKSLDAATADAAGRISLGLFFAETNGNRNIGNANKYKSSFDSCATTASSLSARRTAQEPPRPFAKSSMRCGCSTTNSNAHRPDSKRSKLRRGAGPDNRSIASFVGRGSDEDCRPRGLRGEAMGNN
jgi:hypothetical protein